ncbi:hypothetical protein SXCC_03367 [Gluconacetobacter sp. SXCC-1]|nr:hypothetical protein SXCC_03367 [Gluconacetobacter sp. SXCC-1]
MQISSIRSWFHNPSGPRKVWSPDSWLMPAPVSTTMCRMLESPFDNGVMQYEQGP